MSTKNSTPKPKGNGENVIKPVGSPAHRVIKAVINYITLLLVSHPDGMIQSGRAGSVVHQKNGVRRNFRAPSVVHSSATGRARGLFGFFSNQFTGLPIAAQLLWNNGSFTTTNRLNRVVGLSGKSAFARFNINLSNTGQTLLVNPPVTPLPAMPIIDGVLQAADGAHSLKLLYTPNVDAGEVIVMATPCMRSSIFKPKSGAFKMIGHFDGTAASPVTLTTEYDAVFGTGAIAGVGNRVFIDVITITPNGNASSKVRYTTLVTA